MSEEKVQREERGQREERRSEKEEGIGERASHYVLWVICSETGVAGQHRPKLHAYHHFRY